MQAVVSSLTAVLLFIHTVFGCCWHHAHVCQQQPIAAAATTAGCCQHRHHHEGPQQSESNPHEQPGNCQVNCHGTCNYTVPQKVRVDSPLSIASIDLWPTAGALCQSHLVSAIAWEAAGLQPLPEQPLRLHLLHQLLLI